MDLFSIAMMRSRVAISKKVTWCVDKDCEFYMKKNMLCIYCTKNVNGKKHETEE